MPAESTPKTGSLRAAAASAIVPGLGQWLSGRRRAALLSALPLLVLVALGLDHQRHRSHRETRIAPSPEDRVVLDALVQQPLTFDQLVQRVGLPIQDVAIRIGHLETQGWITANAGWWEALVTS